MVVKVVVELPLSLFFALDIGTAVELYVDVVFVVEVVKVVVVDALGAAPEKLPTVTTLLELNFSAVL